MAASLYAVIILGHWDPQVKKHPVAVKLGARMSSRMSTKDDDQVDQPACVVAGC